MKCDLAIVLTLVAVAAGCGGSKPPADDPTSATGGSSETPPDTGSTSGSEGGDTTPPAESGGLSADQKAQMEVALRRGGTKASQCVDVVPDAARGKGEVGVIFDGTKGRVTDVTVPAPWAGTPAEPCIKKAFIGEYIMPFEGEPLEVPYGIELPEKKAGAAPPKKK